MNNLVDKLPFIVNILALNLAAKTPQIGDLRIRFPIQ